VGKVLSTDGIPDTFLSDKTLKQALTYDKKIIRMVDVIKRDVDAKRQELTFCRL